MKPAAALGFLLALGIWVGHAFAATPGPTQLPTTSLPITTALPKLPTTTVRLPTTTTVPRLPTTTTVPKLPTTTTVPKLPTTTTVPRLPTTTTTPRLPTTTSATPAPPGSPIVTTATTAAKGSSTPSVGSTLDTARSAGSSPSSPFAAAGARSSGAGAGASASGGSASGGSASGRGSDGRPQVQRLESSRPYLTKTGPKNKRRIILSFALSRAGRVFFVVKQLSPDCRIAGRFSVRGHKGVNRIGFRGKVRGKQLAPGTYRISAATRQSERILRVTIVVLERGTPTRAALRAARAANVCPPPSLLAASSGSFVGSSGAAELTAPAKQGIDIPLPGGSAAGTDSPAKSTGGVLGAAVESIAAEAIKPLAVILLGIAILLLGLAALPKTAVPDPRLNDVLARHRPEIAAAGAAAMVTGILYFLIS